MGTSDSILEVQEVSRSFGGVHAVDGCTFTVPRNSITALIGPNGAGKSTAVDLISGFIKPDSGTVSFLGREIQGLSPYQIARRGLQRTFQECREWNRLTVMENMLVAADFGKGGGLLQALFGRRGMNGDELSWRDEARALLQRFGVDELKDEYAGNLSGGQKKLLEFARIAVAKPAMLLLDEPLAGVNPVIGIRIATAVRLLRDSGVTILLIEHNLPFIERVADRVIVMTEGRVIADGSMAEIRANPAVIDAYLGTTVAGA